MRRLAIFDFDGTILRGNSWHEFFSFELRRNPVRAPVLLGAYVLRRLRWWSGERLRDFALRGLRGLSVAQVAAIGEHLHDTRLAAQVRPAALATIEQRRVAGYTIIIATGTFDFVVAPFARAIRADHIIATQVAFDGDRCLGRPIGVETLGPAKAAAVLAAAESLGAIDWPGSCAYTDSTIDRDLLALVGEPVMVAPSSKFPRGAPARTHFVCWEP